MAEMVRVLSTLALKGAVGNLAARFEAESGARIDADFAPTLALLERLRGGEGADVVILTKEALDDLAAKGTVVADELRRSGALLCRHRGEGRRRSSRYRDGSGAAGDVARRAVGGLFASRRQRHFLRATDRANGHRRRHQRPARKSFQQGFTAELLVSDEADLAVQQISELKLVDGCRGRRADPARTAKPGGVFRRPSGGIEQCAIRPAAEVPGLARGGPGAARVRAGALNLPALRSNLWAP